LAAGSRVELESWPPTARRQRWLDLQLARGARATGGWEYRLRPQASARLTVSTSCPRWGNASATARRRQLANLPWGWQLLEPWTVGGHGRSRGSSFATESSFVVVVETLPPTYLSHTSETLHAQVHPLGHPTTAWFEWGLTTITEKATPQTNVRSAAAKDPRRRGRGLRDSPAWASRRYHDTGWLRQRPRFPVGADQLFHRFRLRPRPWSPWAAHGNKLYRGHLRGTALKSFGPLGRHPMAGSNTA